MPGPMTMPLRMRYEVDVPWCWVRRVMRGAWSGEATFWASLPGVKVWDREERKFLTP